MPLVRKILSVHADAAAHHRFALELTREGRPAGPEDRFLIRGEELLCYSMPVWPSTRMMTGEK